MIPYVSCKEDIYRWVTFENVDDLCVLSFEWTWFAHSISPKAKSPQYHVCLRGFIQAERLSQQQWEKELQERERRLKQQEEAFQRLNGLEEMIQTGMLAVEEVRPTKALPCVACQLPTLYSYS